MTTQTLPTEKTKTPTHFPLIHWVPGDARPGKVAYCGAVTKGVPWPPGSANCAECIRRKQELWGRG